MPETIWLVICYDVGTDSDGDSDSQSDGDTDTDTRRLESHQHI